MYNCGTNTLSCSCILYFAENGHWVLCQQISLASTTEAGSMPRGAAEPHPVHRSAYVATETFSDPFQRNSFYDLSQHVPGLNDILAWPPTQIQCLSAQA